MARARTATSSFAQELAEFIASRPTREEFLAFHPSEGVQRHAAKLLQKQNDGEVSYEERQELEEFTYTERLIRLIKARLRADRTPP
jgi:hypothetical protein